ncbi:MAG TPA: ATP-binding protein [bacterium]|nr:ATP-binding protein [bacterium]
MKQMLVISGKGGTGKTILTASFAVLAENKIMVDCDVDAADLHLMLHPEIKERHEFRSGTTAVIDASACVSCGRCKEVCRFGAVAEDGGRYAIDPIGCEGCGLCSRICPVAAIAMEENVAGEWFVSDTKLGPFVHAKLGIAEENSGKLVAHIRKVAKEKGEKERRDLVIIDGPPGIGCPVIASLSGVDLAVIVTEPTVSGIHDMMRVAEVAGHFKIPAGVVINKYDLNPENADLIEKECRSRGISLLGRIPFSSCVSAAIVKGVAPVTCCRDGVAVAIAAIWEKVKDRIS